MAAIYFGDGFSGNSGDWNSVDNWYSSKGFYCCGSDYPGTPMGRLPVDGTDTVHIVAPVTTNSPAVWNGNIVMEAGIAYPVSPAGKISSGVWNGTITGGGLGQSGTARCELAGGTFNGTVGCRVLKISGGTFASAVSMSASFAQSGAQNQITGGTFNAAVVIEGLSVGTEYGSLKLPDSLISAGTFNSTVNVKGAKVTGGTFYGAVTSNMPFPVGDKEGTAQEGSYVHTRIAGGTYMPLATVALTKSGGAWTLDTTTLPLDPGFKQGGGTFAPRITLTGLPDILGAGL
ncbi:MAG: hypothetical protein B7Z37_16930 [Verrucomicrobia bacterium 12-59-8]|nr:MAG: hypothetical protein B7Z37_16930 [Verrucomicrobia bacterium 12-59-8]